MLQVNLTGGLVLLGYYLVVAALMPILLRLLLGIPRELARKIHHVAYSLSIFIILELFSAWYYAVAAAFSLVLLGYPFLLLVEKHPWYRRYSVDRNSRGGELRRQLLYVQLSFALLTFFFWGVLGVDWRYVAAVAVMAWGFGDAAAALIGKAYGRRHYVHVLVDRCKTREGTLAMVVFAGLAAFLTLSFYGGLSFIASFLAALVLAPVCGLIELISRRGSDTLTVPFTAAFSIMPLLYLFNLLGW